MSEKHWVKEAHEKMVSSDPPKFFVNPVVNNLLPGKGRISRDRMFMEIAETVAKRGTCDRARVGAVLVDSNHNIISIGYNGSPHGEPHCDEVGHLMFNGHCMRTIHAEENCINRLRQSLRGDYIMYVTHYPCVKCQAFLFHFLKKHCQPGTAIEVIYRTQYGEPTAFEGLPEVHQILQFTSFENSDIM